MLGALSGDEGVELEDVLVELLVVPLEGLDMLLGPEQVFLELLQVGSQFLLLLGFGRQQL